MIIIIILLLRTRPHYLSSLPLNFTVTYSHRSLESLWVDPFWASDSSTKYPQSTYRMDVYVNNASERSSWHDGSFSIPEILSRKANKAIIPTRHPPAPAARGACPALFLLTLLLNASSQSETSGSHGMINKTAVKLTALCLFPSKFGGTLSVRQNLLWLKISWTRN